MLSRHWGALFAAFGLTIVAFGSGAYIAALGYGHGEEQCAKSANGAPYAEQDCPRQIDTDRHGLPYLAESIASNPEPKDTNEREQRDLAAQESMSVWAFWMMAFSAVGIVITSIGTGFLLWQIILTRKAVEDTGNATKAMEIANDIARRAVEYQTRAWLAFDIAIEQMAVDNPIHNFEIRLDIKNVSQSPAVQVAVAGEFFDPFAGGRAPNEWIVNKKTEYAGREAVGFMVVPQETHRWGVTLFHHPERRVKLIMLVVSICYRETYDAGEVRQTAKGFLIGYPADNWSAVGIYPVSLEPASFNILPANNISVAT